MARRTLCGVLLTFILVMPMVLACGKEPEPTPNIEATVQARVQATVEARPETAVRPPVPTPVPAAAAFRTPTPTATPTPSPTTVPSPTPTSIVTVTPAPPPPLTILRAAFDATNKVDTLHFVMDLEITVAAPGLSMTVPMTLDGDFQTPDRFQGTFAMSLGFIEFETQVITVGETTYFTNPDTGEWEIETEEAVPFGGPARFLETDLSVIRDLVLVGLGELDGVEVYRLSGVLPAETLGEEEISGDLEVEYWVGVEDFLLRRIALEGDLDVDDSGELFFGGSGPVETVTLSMTLEFSDFGKPVAAIVAPEVVPLSSPMERARLAEFENVSTAVTALQVENNLSIIPNPYAKNDRPCNIGTQDMTVFPDSTSVAGSPDKATDPETTTYQEGDKAGYVLFGHDITADSDQSALVNYITMPKSMFCYTVDNHGTVHQYFPDETGAAPTQAAVSARGAAVSERDSIQTAVDAYMVENAVTTINGLDAPTNDFSATSDQLAARILDAYLTNTTTTYCYTWNSKGEVTQSTKAPCDQPVTSDDTAEADGPAVARLRVEPVPSRPLTVRFIAEIVGGRDNAEELYCKWTGWEFGDGR